MKKLRIGVIGAGLQAARRIPAIVKSGHEVVVVSAEEKAGAVPLAEQWTCEADKGWADIVQRSDLDAVLVLTPPDLHADITVAAAGAGKHVLCEKPLAVTLDEAQSMVDAADRAGVILKCGFNHRHHPAVAEAKRLLDKGEIGRPITGRCRYGICGRPGYEKEWRSDVNRVAGGHLMEQGIHGLDLFRWFLGDLVDVVGFTQAAYWPTAPLEDNGYALVRAKSGAVGTLHSSLTQWKNLFSFEVFGEDGYLLVEGLGGSYGTQSLSVGSRDFEKPFEDRVIHYRGGDRSWEAEWRVFLEAVETGTPPVGDGHDGLEALRAVLSVYESERTRSVVSLA